MNERGRNEPTAEDLRGAPVLPGFELPDSVTLACGVVHADGLQPEDIGVLAWLRLRDPRKPAKQEDLAREMQAQGWKMGKGRFASIFQRLKAAGHIKHHCPYNPETGRPEWRIEFFMNPANNDQYINSGISSFPQAGAGFPKTGDPQVERAFGNPETGVSAGQKGFPVSGDPLPDSQKPGIPSRVIDAGQARNPENPVSGPIPPLPPGGGGGSSPYPLHDEAQPQPEGKAFSAEEIAAAAGLLQELPDPWVIGEDDARRIAPKLLTQMRRKEWPTLPKTDHKALTACLTANPGGINNHVSILENKRIPNLPAYRRAAGRSRRSAAQPAEGMCARHPNWPEDDCMSCQTEERARRKRPRSEPATVDGAGLLARLRAGLPAE
ncbi:hypothetical protein [Streptomyces sp. DSM 41534]